MPHKITVKTNGQTLTVNASVSHWTSSALALAASGDDDIPSTTTTTITSDYDLWFANTATTATITVKQLDGTTLLADTFQVSPAYGNRTLNPLPSLTQVAADLSRPVDPHALTGNYQETLPRWACASTCALASGYLRLGMFTATRSETVTALRAVGAATAAGATPTLAKLGLYTVASDTSLTLVASTASDTALFAVANTTHTVDLAASYAVTAGRRYAIGVIVVTGATATIVASAFGSASTTNFLHGPPVISGLMTAQSDLPASIAAVGTGYAAATNGHYFATYAA